MSDEEASHGASDQEIYLEESASILPVPLPFQHLFERVVQTHNRYEFSPIYVVPSRLREVNPSAFIPRLVSIGPLHKGHRNLKSMENKKATYLTRLLHEVGSPAETFNYCMQIVMDSIERIRGYYFGMETYTDEELALMMVIDGCFILQFIRNLSIAGNVISGNRLRSRNIALDLVLLENQIPFFVLVYIYNLTVEKLPSRPPLITMLGLLLELVNPFHEPLRVENLHPHAQLISYHILGLLHQFYKPIDFKLPIISVIPTAHSAVELYKVAVKIWPDKNVHRPMDIKFEYSSSWYKPTLKMPVVRVDNFFEVVLRNLIAYEQYSPVDNYVTSYAMAMHMLAATPADIALLGKSGVIVSHLGSNEKVSDMISSICKDVILQDFYYSEPWKNIVKHCGSYWPRNFGVLKRTYFDTPWKTIAVLAAITVFLITIIQFFRQLVTPFD